ncbi:hypothetical protein [Janthinobacterium sp. EB271-G4-7A]|uniref:hypothetical protein n=1 Tax=Janthinobacterium sp. EB271-G4-7A TaxID=2775056 RepID=UPI001E39F0B9|nr:hypothetical protein [Janthinobacterium sp. EB271-G4-7A]MCC7698746.1 hypothetical protein [Janthinobacterium sp. EB271-G4-7A]
MALLLGDLDNLAFAEDNSLAMPVILLTIFFAAAIDVRVGLVGVTDNNGRRRESRFLVLVNIAYLPIALALCWCSGMAGFNSGGGAAALQHIRRLESFAGKVQTINRPRADVE